MIVTKHFADDTLTSQFCPFPPPQLSLVAVETARQPRNRLMTHTAHTGQICRLIYSIYTLSMYVAPTAQVLSQTCSKTNWLCGGSGIRGCCFSVGSFCSFDVGLLIAHWGAWMPVFQLNNQPGDTSSPFWHLPIPPLSDSPSDVSPSLAEKTEIGMSKAPETRHMRSTSLLHTTLLLLIS